MKHALPLALTLLILPLNHTVSPILGPLSVPKCLASVNILPL